jgi:hypothetical protein
MLRFKFDALISQSGQLAEVAGIVVAKNKDEALAQLNGKGYFVKYLDVATPEEVRLVSLRELRRELSGDNKLQISKTAKKRRFPYEILVFVGLGLLVLLVTWLRK